MDDRERGNLPEIPVNEVRWKKLERRKKRASLKIPDTHHFSIFRAWRVAIIQNMKHTVFLIIVFFFSLNLCPFPQKNERKYCNVRGNKKQKYYYNVTDNVTLWSYPVVDGRHLSASRNDKDRNFDEEIRAICRIYETCRNFIRQTRMLFFFHECCKSWVLYQK